MKIAVTGHTGFIGSHLTQHLSSKNVQWVGYEDDPYSPDDIEQFFKTYRPTHLIHLTATYNPPIEHQVRKNMLTTQLFCQIGAHLGLKKIIYSSSGIVYGSERVSSEDDQPNPRTLYGLTKYCAELLVKMYGHSHHLGYIILRFPTIFGPGHSKNAIDDIIASIKTEHTVHVHGDGEQRRHFMHVDDVCDVLYQALSIEETKAVYNIAPFDALSVNDLVSMLKKYYDFRIVHDPKRDLAGTVLMDNARASAVFTFPKDSRIEAYIADAQHTQTTNVG